ncbi:MAG: elongation factor Ts [Bacteroidetes bacterium]|nr:elongation factor Ts [Bacteroidota bacterium]
MSTVMISAADVNKLRQITGAGMMDCKKALSEANGDFEAAIDFLRKKGQKVAANRSDRDAKEGLVVTKVTADGKRGVLVVVNCETDFVAKNEEFGAFVNTIVDVALASNPKTAEELKALNFTGTTITVGEKITEQVGKIGEKIEISRYEVIIGEKVLGYNHPGNRVASLVGFNKSTTKDIDVIAKDVAMQIAAMAPVALDKDDVDAETLKREIEIGKEQARQEGKPEEMLEKIAMGKLNKFYKESTLLNQEFIKDNKISIGQYLANNDKELKILGFKRHSLS